MFTLAPSTKTPMISSSLTGLAHLQDPGQPGKTKRVTSIAQNQTPRSIPDRDDPTKQITQGVSGDRRPHEGWSPENIDANEVPRTGRHE